eukprot:Hpha_TRINITY_DN16757_c3_g1::TRINITY_DN16757_c3_g1_i38::g.76699::m.76699
MATEQVSELMGMKKQSDTRFKELNKDLKNMRRTLGEGGISSDSTKQRLARRMRGSPVSVEKWTSLTQRLIDYTRFRYRTQAWSDAELRMVEGMQGKKDWERPCTQR